MAGHTGRTIVANQKGAVLILFALLLLVLIGFVALAMEAGRWYMIRAELSKSVDAAALAGAKNISNPYVNPLTLAQEFGQANFPTGYAGTPATGTGAAAFTASQPANHQIQVTGSVMALAYLARLFGVNQVTTSTSGVAKMNQVEIMLVLDRSGSMAGQPESDLKNAAITFLQFFTDTQATDKVGLISFATSVTVAFPLSNNFVTPMTAAINAMTAVGATNTEDAIAQASGPSGFTNQTGIPGNQRVQQFLILFTDGNPTAFRGTFKNNNTNYDAVVCGTGNYCDQVWPQLGNPNSETWLNVNPVPTGDGLSTSSTSCCSGNSCTQTTQWNIFSTYPVPGYGPQSCNIPSQFGPPLAPYICQTAITMAIANAQTLKNNGVMIYTIGLGVNINQNFLASISSGTSFQYYAPTSSDLLSIFNLIAKDIKLRLVQ
ncbi:MAG TPA: vWA domain-containing protein [Syntrophorhabdales bacterium]|nr:vWA domain-containing protein [Syntrophorhabdales bacterium]